jgi:YbbR domain-containing protein
MMAFLINNIATILISGLLLALVLWIVISMIKKKKRGKSIGCNCGCDSCAGNSFCHEPEKKDHSSDQ